MHRHWEQCIRVPRCLGTGRCVCYRMFIKSKNAASFLRCKSTINLTTVVGGTRNAIIIFRSLWCRSWHEEGVIRWCSQSWMGRWDEFVAVRTIKILCVCEYSPRLMKKSRDTTILGVSSSRTTMIVRQRRAPCNVHSFSNGPDKSW